MTKYHVHRTGLLVAALALCACGESHQPPQDSAADVITHLNTFKDSDRPAEDPGGPGERRAIEYAKTYLSSLGLTTTVQTVPLVRMIPSALLVQIHGPNGEAVDVSGVKAEAIVWPSRQAEQVAVRGQVVFAGYGIVAPEYHRDDYKQTDVTGKVVLVMEGSPRTNGRDDLGVLGSTYYGTRQYKYTEAAKRGAAAVLIIHTDPATTWKDVQATTAGAVIDIDARSMGTNDAPRAAAEGWLSRPGADRLCGLAAVDPAVLFKHAHQLAFEPVVMPGIELSINITSQIVRQTSYDVFAILPGQTSEYVLLAGRWNRLEPETWANRAGAMAHAVDDDGSGATVVLEAARRLVTEYPTPLRTIVFMVATALEPGILGLEHFTEHPPETMPVDRMTAMIFLDHGDLMGTSARVGKIGIDTDEALSQLGREVATEQGRLFELDEHQGKRFYYTAGQTELGRDGVRSIYLTTRPLEDGTSRVLRDRQRRDHMVSMHPPPGLVAAPNLSKDAALLTNLTIRVANVTNWPPRIEPVPPIRR